jgi:hypothetical protein
MRFRTKFDLWIVLVLTIVPVGALLVIALSEEPWVLALMLPIWALVALVCLPCDYTLEEDKLVVRSGLIKWRVPYSEIKRVYPTRCALSAPAWSLDRIAIAYGKSWVMVSPKEKLEFLKALMDKAKLKASGEELVPQGH